MDDRAPRAHYGYLDLARGLAALAVFAGHLRVFVFVDFREAGPVGPLWQLFYFVTGMGHLAVMVFFVLSGFLVGKNVSRSVAAGEWSWRVYGIKRLSRLWLVLLPALVLTALFDRAGQYLALDPAFYSGALHDAFHSGPAAAAAATAYDLKTFLLNALFLQTILAPTFGTNGPLWSLANEFWYYALFPLLFLALCGRPFAYRLVCAGVAAALCWLLPFWLVSKGLVWLFGYLAFEASARIRFGSAAARRGAIAITFAVFVAVLIWSRLHAEEDSSNFLVGAAFAVFVVAITHSEIPSRLLARTSSALAEMSYTLYLVHFPAAAFLAAALLRGHRFAPAATAAAVYAALFGVVLFYAWLVYLLFERHTAGVQRRLTAGLNPGPGIN